MNTIGRLLRLTTFGESHGKAIGGVLDGFPAGFPIDLDFIQDYLDRRKPGQSNLTTQRQEEDQVEILSGVFHNTSTGAPIAFLIKNKDQRSTDYQNLEEVFRPSHADYTYLKKYGLRDHMGGGRSSARETAIRVAAGSLALDWLNSLGIHIRAYVKQVHTISVPMPYTELDLLQVYNSDIRCPHTESAQKMISFIEEIRKSGDSCGGIIEIIISNVPPGLGSPVYAKLHAELGAALLSINAVKGIEFGSGFDSVTKLGSELNDVFYSDEEGNIKTRTNNSGGVQGGISNGEDIVIRLAFKPTATISKSQETVNIKGESIDLQANGRHDPCVLPRAVPIVETMTALVIADHLLLQRTTRTTI